MQGFLKCDAAGCTHREPVEALTQDLVGKPCPICGANLLTQEDFDDWHASVAPMIEILKAMGIAKPLEPGDAGEAGVLAVSVSKHAGKVTIEAEVRE